MERSSSFAKDEVGTVRTSRQVFLRLKYTNEISRPAVNLIAAGAYHKSGTSDLSLPLEIRSGNTAVWSGRKWQGPFPAGTIGVLVYKTTDGNTLAVMWSVPFFLFGGIFDAFCNTWNVRMFDGARRPDEALFDEMKRGSNRGDDIWRGPVDIGQSYQMIGIMASSARPVLDIRITKATVQNRQNNFNNN